MMNVAFADELLEITKYASLTGLTRRVSKGVASTASSGGSKGYFPSRVPTKRVVKKSYKNRWDDKHGYDRWDFPRTEWD